MVVSGPLATPETNRVDAIAGVILGTAVGDALGLPRENLTRDRARKFYGRLPLRHRFLFGRGLVSDDTEHTCLVGNALLKAPFDAGAFSRSLAWRLRFWLIALPAGVGFATLRSIEKLWIGFPPERSGVYSAGNGPAMRAAILGVCMGSDPQRLRAYIRASTRLTHTDPRAERGALLVALAAYHGLVHGADGVRIGRFLEDVRAAMPDLDVELQGILNQMDDHHCRDAPATELADALGLQRGVSGYVYHTVPLALYCWLRHPSDFRRTVEEVIDLGGDTDTTGAIVGGITGATVGAKNIPEDWLNGLIEWPRSVSWMRRLASRLASRFSAGSEGKTLGPLSLFWPGLIPRNLVFLVIVLIHGFRRLLPPY